MEIFEGHQALFRPLARPAVALGNFDGVHVGHQKLLSRAAECAGPVDGDVVVYTFDPHPAQVLAPDLAPPLITSQARKLELLAAAGASVCILEPFTLELAALPPDKFHEILANVLMARTVIVGYDFTYGHVRSGTISTLRSFCEGAGIDFQVIDAVDANGLVASSTKIREFIEEGNMPGASVLLGRHFDVDGTVVRGAGRGRTIGIPTANVATEAELMPPTGVYAVWLRRLDRPDEPARAGAANLGVNPTFQDEGRLSLEVHVLDFEGDLYDSPVRVEFARRLRGEKRFSGPDELVAQIHQDIAQIRELL